MSAQQEFLKAVISQAPGFNLPVIAFTAQAVTETNMSMPAQAAFLARMTSVSGGTFNTYTVPGTTGMQDSLSYFFHDPAATKAMMLEIYQNSPSS